MNCLNCFKNTSNPSFCNRSCAATYNNIKKKKRQLKTTRCKRCQEIIQRKDYKHRPTVCCKCRNKYGEDPTIEEATYKHLHRSSAFCFIRGKARKAFDDVQLKCSVCGYDKHVQIAHKKSIASFPLNTRLSVVNHVDNLMTLCPNCHWEFDHYILNKV